MKELEDLPVDAQEKVLKLVHFVKKEMLISHGKRSPLKKGNALLEIDEIAIETGIPDLARQHDHYLYGVSKK
jgi:hypothetical protein